MFSIFACFKVAHSATKSVKGVVHTLAKNSLKQSYHVENTFGLGQFGTILLAILKHQKIKLDNHKLNIAVIYKWPAIKTLY